MTVLSLIFIQYGVSDIYLGGGGLTYLKKKLGGGGGRDLIKPPCLEPCNGDINLDLVRENIFAKPVTIILGSKKAM